MIPNDQNDYECPWWCVWALIVAIVLFVFINAARAADKDIKIDGATLRLHPEHELNLVCNYIDKDEKRDRFMVSCYPFEIIPDEEKYDHFTKRPSKQRM